jgi:hypothetical protein
MTPTALGGRLSAWRSRLVRPAAAVVLLVPAVYLGTPGVTPASAASLCGASTNVTGNVHNQTNVVLFLSSASLGITNAWCQSPSSPLVDKFPTFYAGDNVFDTVVQAAYNAPNGDIISLSGRAGIYGGNGGSCSVSGSGGSAPAYACRPSINQNGDQGGINVVADFYITPVSRVVGAVPRPVRPFLRVAPSKTHPGAKITLEGAVGTRCQSGGKGELPIVYSEAFTGATNRSFHRIPAVFVRHADLRNGKFSIKLRLSSKLKTGNYRVSGRCAGVRIGSSLISVTQRRGRRKTPWGSDVGARDSRARTA